ncbi:ABC transporter ATP-binding protein [Gottfriedia solisilvae]|uniref:Putative ABC transporter ATP-binding protein n=1 Tax=Gottfriedia solisilvae TaxID=1516104 RepID=A0A8J3AJQ8_9BACI|nr:ABC transporter ATP-binding protein [Gottfriedia solisilvae]GGI11058.1 putative ABC transporter ATP-binding protein [Gottfriedia solisilvae]
MKKAIIEFRNFSFQYKAQAKPTLKDINLTIYEGEKILIVGSSGSGKSTISHCLNGLVPSFYEGEISGSLKINGKETRNQSIFELSQHVGTVLQDPDAQFIGLTVAEDIGFKLENTGVHQSEMIETVKSISKMVGIDRHLHSAPHQLSGGQKQRVTLGGVMVDQANILLFDEPLANLDPATGKIAMELINDIHQKTNSTIIIIEHRLEEVLQIDIDRIIVINEGEILANVSTNELLSANLLENLGIREPLYITALKYAGCEITPETEPKNIDSIKIDSYINKLTRWFHRAEKLKKLVDDEVVLELKSIDFSYRQNEKIIHNVSFKINKGEMVSIVGKNGAGKSTISKLICGFYQPTNGEIFFEGNDMKHLSIKERAEFIGIVLQNPNQMISQTSIFDEVALGLKFRGVSQDDIKERVMKTLKVCGLYEFRNWPISALSFGQKKRVTIASVLVLNPKILILDEPTAGQDYKHYNEMMEFLKELQDNGMTIILITHDMHLMLEYTKRAIVFSDGRIIADDSSANILTNSEVIKQANLKETSLQQLAKKANIFNSVEFVHKFIEYDRRVRA